MSILFRDDKIQQIEQDVDYLQSLIGEGLQGIQTQVNDLEQDVVDINNQIDQINLDQIQQNN